MGLVKIDIHKNEHQYKQITLSDVDVIKGLIKYRWMIDPYIDFKDEDFRELRNNDLDYADWSYVDEIMPASNVVKLNQELIVTYIDLDNLLSKINLSSKQKYIIEKLMIGWSIEDIAEVLNQKPYQIENILDTVCHNIKKLNDQQWKYDYVYLNYKKVEWNYKQCNKCGEVKPAIEEFFRIRKDGYGDGFYNHCRNCEN